MPHDPKRKPSTTTPTSGTSEDRQPNGSNNDAIVIVGASWLIPLDETTSGQSIDSMTAINNGAVAMLDGNILAVGEYSTLAQSYPSAQAEFLEGHILLPGLINCHTHAAMALYRGYADDLPLQLWLEQHIWPAEGKHTDAEFVADGTQLAIAEMLMSGTTTFSDMYFYPTIVAKTANALGMRAQIAFPILEFPSTWANDANAYIDQGLALFDDYKYNDQITIGFGPHAPYTVSDKTFERVVMLAEEVDAPIQLHLHETEQEVLESTEQFSTTPIQRLAKLGVLSPRAQAVHVTQLSASDHEILAQSGASVIHCPTSNMKLASGYCDIVTINQTGMRLGFGTDGAASNNTLDMFDTLRMAALLAKQHHRDAAVVSAKQTLFHATLGGAQALGIDHLTGSLSTGKQADMISVDCNHPALQPVHQPISTLAYTQAGAAVSNVWISGERKLKDGKLTGIELTELLDKVRRRTQQLAI